MKRIRYNSPVILTFTLVSLVVLLLGLATKGWTTHKLFSVYRFSPGDILGYFRLFGHVLGHASLQHYVGNITLMLVIGPMLEEKYGSKTLLLSIAITALVSGLVQCLISPDTYLLGASGIVFMMIMLSSLAGMEAGTVPLTMILVAVFYIGGEIVNGIANQDSVSQVSHVIGGLCGTAIGFVLAKMRQPKRGA